MKKDSKWTWFVLLVIFLTGTFLLIITPMGANYDEETHLARIWEMSFGKILPNSLYHEVDRFPAVFFDSSFRRYANFPVIDLETWKEQANLYIDFNNYMKYTTRGVYFPTIYGVQAILIGITGRLFDFPILYIFYVLRFSYLLIYCVFIYLTMRVLPTGRHLFGVIAMAPVAIIQSAAISADAFVFGVSFLFTGWVLHLLAEPSKILSRRQMVITCILILAVGTLKPNCVFLLFLLPVLPFSLKLTRRQKLALLITSLVSIAISVSWSFVASQFFLARDDAGKDPIGQFLTLFKEPTVFFSMFSDSLRYGWWTLMMQSIGIAGYGYWVLPKFIYFLFPAVIVLSVLADSSDFRLSWKQSIYFAAVALFNVFMIYMIFFVIETEVWAEEINGVQGRYISPFFLLFFSAFLFLFKFKFKAARFVSGAAMALIAIVAAFSIYLDYHITCGSFWLTQTECTIPRYKNWDTTSFSSFTASDDIKIEEIFTANCSNVNGLRLWVTDNSKETQYSYTVSLLDENRQLIRSVNANATTTVASGWMDYPFEAIAGANGKQFTVVITSQESPSLPGVQFGTFSKNEFIDGYLQINGNSGNYPPDLVMQYNCEKFGQ
jgi:uncharacterized membrane protein